jgi:hypothetical protein
MFPRGSNLGDTCLLITGGKYLMNGFFNYIILHVFSKINNLSKK